MVNSHLWPSSPTVPVSPELLSGPQRICPVRPPSASSSFGGPSAPPPAATGETVSPVHYNVPGQCLFFCFYFTLYSHFPHYGIKMSCLGLCSSLSCFIDWTTVFVHNNFRVETPCITHQLIYNSTDFFSPWCYLKMYTSKLSVMLGWIANLLIEPGPQKMTVHLRTSS